MSLLYDVDWDSHLSTPGHQWSLCHKYHTCGGSAYFSAPPTVLWLEELVAPHPDWFRQQVSAANLDFLLLLIVIYIVITGKYSVTWR